MALFKIFKGSSSKLPLGTQAQLSGKSLPYQEGFAYFTPDTGRFYIDANGERIALNAGNISFAKASSSNTDGSNLNISIGTDTTRNPRVWVPAATSELSGIVSISDQTFGGAKNFLGQITAGAGIQTKGIIAPFSNNKHSLGTSNSRWSNVYSEGFTLHAPTGSYAYDGIIKAYGTAPNAQGNGGSFEFDIEQGPAASTSLNFNFDVNTENNPLDGNEVTSGTIKLGLDIASGTYITAGKFQGNLAASYITGTLAVGKGGTGTSTAPKAGGIIYGASTSAYGCTSAGTSGQVLTSGGTGSPTWTGVSTTNSSGTIVKRDINGNFTAGTITATLSGNASSATKLATSHTFITNLASTTAGSFNGTADATVGVTGVLSLANGGTDNNLSDATKGSIVYVAADGSGLWYSGVGASGDVLTSGGSGAPTWTSVSVANSSGAIVKRDINGNFGAGTITANKIIVGTANADSHILFQRESYNYLAAPKNGVIAFSPGSSSAAGSTTGVGAHLAVTYGAVIPGQNNGIVNLGSSSYKWKNVYATTFTGDLSGNASTATSAGKWTTARSITLTNGAAGSVLIDGSESVTLPVTSISESYLAWGGKHINGGVSPVGAALSAEHSANRIAYLNPAAMSFETSSDGGSTWTALSMTNAEKTNLVTLNGTLHIGPSGTVTTNYRSRMTISAQSYVYTRPRKLLINCTTNGHSISVTIEIKKGTSGAAWETVGTYAISGWSGWNDIPLSFAQLGGGASQTSNYWFMRLTFATTAVSTNTSYASTRSAILGLRLFGDTCWTRTSNMGETGHLYSYDASQNATFPAVVTASGGFSGSGASLTNLNASNISSGTIAAARLPKATTSALGAVMLGYSASGKNYAIQADSNGKLYVNVPWTDNNTTYTAGTGLTLSGTQFSVSSANVSTMMNLLGEGTSPAQLNDYLIAQYAGGGTSTTTYHRRKVSNVVNATVVKAALGTGTGTTKYLREDGTWVVPPNTTYSAFTGATSSAAGKAGLVPAPASGKTGLFLRSDGTWYDLIAIDGTTLDTFADLKAAWEGADSTLTATLNNAIGAKQNTITGAATTITSSDLTANRALISNGNGKVAVSAVTSTELGYLDGVTSAIQTQLNAKVSSVSASGTAPLTLNGSIASGKLTLTGSVANASATSAGVVTTGTQTFAGAKYFDGGLWGTAKTGTSSTPFYILPKVPYSLVDETHTDATYFQGLLKWICQNYSISSAIVYALVNPNSQGYAHIQFYNTSSVDATTGLPQYASGVYYGLGGSITRFGTNNYTYYCSASSLTDTKNTAGSTNTSSKIFLIGATSQASNPTTYSHDTVYVNTDGHLYSNSKQVVNLSDSQALTNKTYNGYTLAAACAKGVTDSSSASAIGTGTSLPTERDIYYGLPTINNSHSYTSSTTIYAPSAGGTAGQVLMSAGATATPTWGMTLYSYTTAAMALSLNTWTNVATAANLGNPATGTYVIQVTAGGVIYSGIMSWDAATTTASVYDEILLHSASTSTAHVTARINRTSGLYLQLCALDAAVASGAITIKMRQVI